MKNEDEWMKKFLRHELNKEAVKITAEVNADESLRDVVLPKNMDAELQAKIDQYEIERIKKCLRHFNSPAPHS